MKLCSKIEKKEYLFCSSNNNAYLCKENIRLNKYNQKRYGTTYSIHTCINRRSGSAI